MDYTVAAAIILKPLGAIFLFGIAAVIARVIKILIPDSKFKDFLFKKRGDLRHGWYTKRTRDSIDRGRIS